MNARYCVIGNPVAHSKSPEIHAAFAAETAQQLSYERCLAPLDGFEATVRDLIAAGYAGANVTVPFKLEAFALATRRSARAEAAGAVNTLTFAAGEIVGDNTDGAGLVNDIVQNAGVALSGKRILLLGAGGAARGVILPLLATKPGELVIANRTPAAAEALVTQFAAAGAASLTACGFAEIAARFDVVINATSASLSASMPAVPAAAFGPGTLALDMMYGSAPTPFMAFAAAQGAATRDGLGMLVEQAAEAFYIWRGVRPRTASILCSIRQQL